MSVLTNFMYKFNTMSVKILENYFINIDKLILKFIFKKKKKQKTQNNPKQFRRIKVKESHYPISKLTQRLQ